MKNVLEDRARNQKQMHFSFQCKLFTFLIRKLCSKPLNKIKPQSPKENEVHTYRAPDFAPDYSAAVLATKMCTYSNEHSM